MWIKNASRSMPVRVLAWSVLSVVVTFVVPWAAGDPAFVHADTPCLDAVSSLPGELIDNVDLGFAGAPLAKAPTLSPVSVPGLGGAPVLTAGASIAGGTSAGTAALLIGGAAVAGVGAGCFFVDVLNADKLFLDASCGVTEFFFGINIGGACAPEVVPAQGHENVSWGSWTCVGCSGRARRTITFDSPITGMVGQHMQIAGPGRPLQRGGVSIPDPGINPIYEQPNPSGSPIALGGWIPPYFFGGFGGGCATYSFSTNNECDNVAGSTTQELSFLYSQQYDPDLGGPLPVAGAINMGGYYGIPPGYALVAAHESDTNELFSLVTPLVPELMATGWARQYMTDSLCENVSTSAQTWRRYTGATFYDRGTQAARPSVARCHIGEVAVETLITKVPSGVTCSIGVACWPNSEIARVVLPTEVIAEVGPCLAVGNGCHPAPVLIENDEGPEDDECEWEPSVTIDLTYCTGTPVPVGVTPDSDLESGETVDVSTTPPGEPASTGTPVEVLDIISDPSAPPPSPPEVETGIDTGTNRPVCQGSLLAAAETLLGAGWTVGDVAAYLGCSPDEDSGVCFPEGWGWFNPVEWVVKPVKCVLLWAFVPPSDEIGDEWDELWGELETAVPFAWVIGGYEAIETASAGMEAGLIAGRSECFAWIVEGELTEQMPEESRSVCPAQLAGPGGALESLAPYRQWIGIAAWVLWLFSLASVVFPAGRPDTITEDNGQMAWNF